MKNKNLLFIYITFFGYEDKIIRALEKTGFNVIAFDERISNHKLIKIIFRLVPIIGRILSLIHFSNILSKIKSKREIHYLFVLKGEVTPRWFIKKIKSNYPNVKTIYYTWDSFQNNKNGLSLIKYFDKKISFDLFDCEKYNLNHRPLFSSQSKNLGTTKINQNLAGSVLTIHSDRVSVLIRIISNLKLNGVKTKHYVYSRIRQLDKALHAQVFDQKIQLHDKPLNNDELNNFLEDVNFIIDINHPKQTGLTMRTFEALSASKKLISTNHYLKNYTFYNENNICIIDRENVKIPEQFIKSEFIIYDKELRELMSIKGWVQEIFGITKEYKWVN